MLDRIAFVLGETFIALRRNLGMGFAAVTTVAISLYVLAGMFYVAGRASSYAETLQGRFEMIVNLKEGATFADIQRTAKYLRKAPGVASAVWIPRQKRWEREKIAHPELTEGYGFDESPYPDAFKVVLSDLSLGDTVAATARKMSTVDPRGGVQYFAEAQNLVAQWIRVARNLAYSLGGLLFVVAGILVLNAIRLTVESRRVEIRVMRLVGASRSVVSLPFIFEGVLHGGLGGAIAALGLAASQRVVELRLAEYSIGATLAPFPTASFLLALCAVGAGYGGLCSTVALRTPLRARHD